MVDNTTIPLNIFNKMKHFPPLSDRGENVGRNWCEWKKKFLSLLHKEDANEIYKDQWILILSRLIGPLGQQACFTFQNAYNTKNIEPLLFNLDLYFIFGHKKKQDYENIDIYVDSLMLIAIASNHINPVKIVKEKIIQEIRNYNFTGKARLILQSKGENLILYLQLLDLDKILLFWKQCEGLQKNYANVRKYPISNSQFSTETKCVRCGTCHSRNRCPAHGKQCENCGGYNHLKDYCMVKYVSNCPKCGMHHIQSRCLAFGELCTNCGKFNHFSWLCNTPNVVDCLRCGKDHVISMCPAQGKICNLCKKPNHLKEKCFKQMSMHTMNKNT